LLRKFRTSKCQCNKEKPGPTSVLASIPLLPSDAEEAQHAKCCLGNNQSLLSDLA